MTHRRGVVPASARQGPPSKAVPRAAGTAQDASQAPHRCPLVLALHGAVLRSLRVAGGVQGHPARYKLQNQDVPGLVCGSSNQALKRTAAGSGVPLCTGLAAA